MLGLRPLCSIAALASLALAAGCSDTGTGIEAGPELCSDGIDNDGDGFTDCEDQDCWSQPFCQPSDVSTGDTAADSSLGDTHGGDGERPSDTAAPSLLCEPCGMGSISGRACSPSDSAAVSNVEVIVIGVDCDGTPFSFQATSGADGAYNFPSVPCGTHELTITRGSYRRFFDVAVATNRNTDLGREAAKQCFQSESARLAVMAGNFDQIQILLLRLGFDFDLYNDDGDGSAAGTIVELLSDPVRMARYDVIFANCGHTHGWMPTEHPAVMPNVRAFILNGGSFYMSDYAWTYGAWAFPDAIVYQRSSDVYDMYTARSPQLIPSGTEVRAQILDGNLSAYLGKTTIDVNFDTGPQIAPARVGPGSFAHVAATFRADPFGGGDFDPEDVPLVISYVPAAGAGRVMYTNFHNYAQASEDMLKILTYLVFTL